MIILLLFLKIKLQFLKVSCNVDSEEISINFWIQVSVKSFGIFCILNGSFSPINDFYLFAYFKLW